MTSGAPTTTVPAGPPVNRRRYLIVAALLVVVAVGAVVWAFNTNPASLQPTVNPNNLPVQGRAPAVTANGWINSTPLSPADLAGKVVVYDFWTYSCVNCVRTLPYVRSWYDRYKADGLVVIGVHSPEFDFEKNHANVTRAVADLGVDWPVALDDDMATWRAFHNNYWPADFIADGQGNIRHQHIGEGDYRQTEDVLRALLGIGPGAPRAAAPTAPAPGGPQPTADITPETYLGVEKGNAARQGPAVYPEPTAVGVDSARLAGAWTGTAEYAQADGAGSAIVLHYQAREVNVVLAPPTVGPVKLLVELDGKPLPDGYRTPQTMVDDQHRTFVTVANADLYRLVLAPGFEGHTLRLTAQSPGLLAFAFTFGA